MTTDPGCGAGLPLARAQLLGCDGRITHTLTLLVDGTVEIRFAEGHRAVVDPRARRVITPGVVVHADLLDAAASLCP